MWDFRVIQVKATRNSIVYSYVLYAYDIVLFCKRDTRTIDEISKLFLRYANLSGHQINHAKSIIYDGLMTHQRHLNIAHYLGFAVGVTPFIYLWVPMFKGRPKPIYFWFIEDISRAKLYSWKAILLSIAGRLQMVKSVIYSMVLHCLLIYSKIVHVMKNI